MSKDLRTEFEELIVSLTVQISKDIFLEDLKAINKSFSELSSEYKLINQNYTKNINGISNEFSELRNSNANINTINSNISKNSEAINKALETLEGKHRIIIDSILLDTKTHFNDYNLKLHNLNEDAREKFKKMITDTINTEIRKSISSFNTKLDNLNIDEIESKQNTLDHKMNQVISKLTDFQDATERLSVERDLNFRNRITLLEDNIQSINLKTQAIFKQTRILIVILYLILGVTAYLWFIR